MLEYHEMTYLRNGDRILFQGDSITNCFRLPNEINNAYQLGSGYPLLIAAKMLGERTCDGLQFLNRGVSGDSIGELEARWDEDSLALTPDVISILVGVNETLRRAADFTATGMIPPDNGSFVDTYRALLDKSLKSSPMTLFVLCEPFLLVTGSVTDAMQSHVLQTADAVRSLASDVEAIFVPLQNRFGAAARDTGPEYWVYDGIHPTAAGHWLISEAWMEAVFGSKIARHQGMATASLTGED